MAAWTIPNHVYADVQYYFTQVGAITVDSSDPNTSAPDAARVAQTPRRNNLIPVFITLTADAACHLEVWWYSRTLAKWLLAVPAQTLASAFATVTVGGPGGTVGIPNEVPVFLRVTANSGSATTIAAIFY